MTNPRPVFDRLCMNQECRGGNRRKMTRQDIVCSACYKRLPESLRRGLWTRNDDKPGQLKDRIALALNWLDEHPEGQ